MEELRAKWNVKDSMDARISTREGEYLYVEMDARKSWFVRCLASRCASLPFGGVVSFSSQLPCVTRGNEGGTEGMEDRQSYSNVEYT
jgi:hypothetical protein